MATIKQWKNTEGKILTERKTIHFLVKIHKAVIFLSHIYMSFCTCLIESIPPMSTIGSLLRRCTLALDCIVLEPSKKETDVTRCQQI